MAIGFYSVVQYCPDRFRAERVNVGLVLLCVDPHAVRVKMAGNHDRAQKLFSIGKPELMNLKFSTRGLAAGSKGESDAHSPGDDRRRSKRC